MAKLEVSIGCKIDKEYEAQLDQAVAITGEDRATFIREAVRVAMTRTIERGPGRLTVNRSRRRS